MSIRMRYALKALAYFFALLTVFGFVYADSDSSFTDIKRLDRIAVIIDERYAEEIDLEELVEEGIDGMLNSLDPYCRYFTDEDFQEFMDNTYGQFEGIGIEVDLRKNNLTIISVLEGTPAYRAGFRPGDKIVAIEGKLTSEMTREEAAKMMRGSAGTSLTLSIHRIGRSDLMKYTLMRESVETKSIPYYSMLNDGLGYIRLTRFTETSYYEMTEALTSLVNSKAKGIILDLRSNPGGLLLEAVRIAGLILEPDKLVVETQSRNGSYTRHFSFNEGISATNIPLAVLVDEGTASAAEILSGAIQDWDRGVIIGSPTYGKGLVQRIIRLDTESALKLTTAKYYIPSGRCIQKIENAGRLDVSSIPEGFPFENGSSPDEFRTSSGRLVEGGGGIKPDIDVAPLIDTEIVKALKQQSLFFDFALNYINDNNEIDSSFIADEATLEQFKLFLNKNGFNYIPQYELRYDSLLSVLPGYAIPEEISRLSHELKIKLEGLKFQRLDADKELIKRVLTEEIMVLKWGQSARYGVDWVNHHPEILKARSILSTHQTYKESFLASVK